jgi:quercetin dioxygenase-like cupin family protein
MRTEPRVVWMPGDVRTEIHLGGIETGGSFCLLVDYPPVGWSLPTHRHHGVAETILVLEGEFEMTVAGERSRLVPGQTVHVAADVVHAGANLGDVPGRRVVIFSPAGMETFFLEVGKPSPGTKIDLGAAVAAASRHGWEFVT